MIPTLLGCGGAEYATIGEIEASLGAYVDRDVRIECAHVKPASGMRLVAAGGVDYIKIEDAAGRPVHKVVES